MTAQVFPNEEYRALEIVNTSEQSLQFKEFGHSAVKGVW